MFGYGVRPTPTNSHAQCTSVYTPWRYTVYIIFFRRTFELNGEAMPLYACTRVSTVSMVHWHPHLRPHVCIDPLGLYCFYWLQCHFTVAGRCPMLFSASFWPLGLVSLDFCSAGCSLFFPPTLCPRHISFISFWLLEEFSFAANSALPSSLQGGDLKIFLFQSFRTTVLHSCVPTQLPAPALPQQLGGDHVGTYH